jgi:catechol 2,3-dioxygenase-like lactoylglutathione lyase family enzyme
MGIQLGMVVLDVRDLQRSIDFYRLLGLEVPDPFPGRPVTVHRMDSGVSIVIGEGLAAASDPSWARPENGYQVFLEFFVGDDAAVDAEWEKLTAAGYHGRKAPSKGATGPYGALIDDPDGNVILISSDIGADPGALTS